jgi:protein transport protein SEC24
MSSLPRLPTRLSVQVRNILAHFSELAGRELPVILARQNADGSELDFANMLVEDKNNGELSYPDCEFGLSSHVLFHLEIEPLRLL